MKTIPNLSRYVADESGTIYSLNYKRTGKIKAIKPAISTDGYLKSMFQKDDGSYKTEAIHRIIALVFFGPKPFVGAEVNHINGIKTDNRPSNLEYVTHSQNIKHSFDMGLQKPKRGELNGMAKLTTEIVKDLREQKKNNGRYWGRNEMAIKLGMNAKHLQRIVNGTDLWK